MKRSLALVVAGAVAASSTLVPALADTPEVPPPRTTTAAAAADPINAAKSPCRQKPDLSGRKPGQLLAHRELAVDPALLRGARMFRILYTTTGVDERKVQASCGLVLMPEKGQKNQVVAWSHGTVGVHQSCQPSNAPDTFLSNGAIKYGPVVGPPLVAGSPLDGIWQGLIDEGRMVTATDYYSGLGQSAEYQQHYVAGVPAGAAVLDSVRAGITLAKKVAHREKSSWRLALWGASQGGHAAIWAGQLARKYYRVTELNKQPPIKQVGVLAVVPASSFVATDSDPASLIGRHLADLDMHAALEEIGPLKIGATGPILFSQVMASWADYAQEATPAKKASFPGYPRSIKPAIDKVLTGPDDGGGVQTAETVSKLCINGTTLPALAVETNRFLTDPGGNAFFVPPVWGAPNAQGVWEGQLDRTCLDDPGKKGLQKWCRWLEYNMPGPEGENPFTKIPRKADGSYAPLTIAQGMDDTLIYCQHPGTSVPAARDCMSRQLYDNFRDTGMCRTTGLSLDLIAAGPTSPASHLSTMYQLADNGNAAYKGSRMDDFLSDAFAGRVKSGCSSQVINK